MGESSDYPTGNKSVKARTKTMIAITNPIITFGEIIKRDLNSSS